jgi:tubulin epsilon
MIDMEEGVVQYANKAKLLRGLFDPETQQITHSSGCGNNWAVGCYQYGPQFREPILEAIRKQAEWCDSLQSFFICHSMGGGTGSGVGSFVLEMLADQFPDVYRFSTAVFPSADDDVVTSPYNSYVVSIHCYHKKLRSLRQGPGIGKVE